MWRFRRLLLVFAFISLLLTGCASRKLGAEVTLVGLDGTTHTLTLAEAVRELDTVSGAGGFVKTTGAVIGPYELEGVPVLPLLDLVGGLPEGAGLEIAATDGYVMVLSYSQVLGNVLTYNSEGRAGPMGGVELIMAHKRDGEVGFDGAPRMAYIDEDPAFTDGHFWVRDVATLTVIQGVDDWEAVIEGPERYVLDRGAYQSLATCPSGDHENYAYEHVDADGETHVYEGVPLWVLVATADGAGREGSHFRFDDAWAREGYTVRVISADGQVAELDSMLVMRNQNVMLAHLRDGEALPEEMSPLRLVGSEVPEDDMIGAITRIELVDRP